MPILVDQIYFGSQAALNFRNNKATAAKTTERKPHMKKQKADLGWSAKLRSLAPLKPLLAQSPLNLFTSFLLGSHSCMSAKAIATNIPHWSLNHNENGKIIS